MLKNTPPLTTQEVDALEKNMRNPRACVSDALFYAHCTGQYDIADMLIETGQEMSRLFIELHEEGMCPDLDSGTGSVELQTFAMANVNRDPRFAQIVELSKLRYMVDLREADAEELVENVRDSLCAEHTNTTPSRVLN